MKEEFQAFLLFQKEIVKSDLEYLKLHFQKIQNGESVALAAEFKGFLKEKGNFYEELPRRIASSAKGVLGLTDQIASAFKQCAVLIRRNPRQWDRDAIPIISMTYLSMEELLEEM